MVASALWATAFLRAVHLQLLADGVATLEQREHPFGAVPRALPRATHEHVPFAHHTAVTLPGCRGANLRTTVPSIPPVSVGGACVVARA